MNLDTSRGIMVSTLDSQTVVNDIDSHGAPRTSVFMPELSKA